jgi:pimeloyl-ACP methyl ester carboxylesterase
MWLYEPVMFGSMKALAAQTPEHIPDHVRTDLQQVFANPRLFDDLDAGGTDAWLEGFVDYWSGPGVWASMPDKVKDLNRAVGWKMFMEVRHQALLERPLSDYRFEGPITLLHGALSPSPAQDMARQLARVNPQARLEVLQGLAHMSLITQADEVVPALRAHWDRVQPAIA